MPLIQLYFAATSIFFLETPPGIVNKLDKPFNTGILKETRLPKDFGATKSNPPWSYTFSSFVKRRNSKPISKLIGITRATANQAIISKKSGILGKLPLSCI